MICCDGTGNEIKEHQSNVLKLYRVLHKSESQVCFYDPGVGTVGDSSEWARFRNKAKGVFGLMTGFGLDANVLEAYRFLMRHYRDGDNVFLFGFSRGAYTVRVLAGFLHLVGLLHPEQEHMAGYALTAYKQASAKDDFRLAWRFQEVLAARRVAIRFMGCWDTVGSVVIPRPDRLYLPSLLHLPYTKTNPSVRVFRHAMAIDERRAMFRLTDWTDPQPFKTNPFVKDEDAEPQDIKQMWFAGVHSDIGGGYPERQSGLAKLALSWMVDEARPHGLNFREAMVKRLVEGQNPAGSQRHYAKPSAYGKLHNSMTWIWPVLEVWPKRTWRREWPARRSALGFYLPLAEPRRIPQGALIHPSVWERRAGDSAAPPYNPVNLPPPV